MQNINGGIYTKKVCRKLLLVQLLLLFVPSLQLFSIQTDNGTIPASMCYFFSLVFVPYLIKQIRMLRLPPWYITGLYGWVFFIAVLRIPQYGLSKNILHWTFGFYLLIVLLNVGRDLTKKEWLDLLETAFCLFACTHFLFTILQNGEYVLTLLDGYFHGTLTGVAGCHLGSLTRGGRNLDATWLSLGCFFVRGKKKSVYVTWAILFAFLGCSRVGVISIVMGVLWSLLYDKVYRLRLNNVKWYVVYAVVMLAVLFGSGMAQAFLGRNLIKIAPPATWFNSGGFVETAVSNIEHTVQRYGSSSAAFLSGRAAIWRNIPQMFRDNPFGYGVGNAMRVMRADYGFTGTEDVVHNVLMQWLLDEGIIGGIWYLSLVALLSASQWKIRPACFCDPFAGCLLVYIVLSSVQFHGGEALIVYVLGAALMCWEVNSIHLRKT